MTYLTHLTSLCPKGAVAHSPGLPPAATLGTEPGELPNRKAVAPVQQNPKAVATAIAVVRLRIPFFPRVAEAATLGFEA